LTIEGLSETQEVDSRPSDAIALAVRYGAPIYVGEEVLNEAGVVSDDDEETEETLTKEESAPVKKVLTKLEQLQTSLKEAIEKEDYEKAAKLRDDIRKMGISEQ
jgi:hypothetical protein